MKERKTGKADELVTWKACGRVLVCVLVCYLVISWSGTLLGLLSALLAGIGSILAGAAVAYLANIPMRALERALPGTRGDGTANRLGSLMLTVVLAVLFALFVLLLVLPELVGAVASLATAASETVTAFSRDGSLEGVVPAEALEWLGGVDWEGAVQAASAWLQSGIAGVVPQVTTFFGRVAAWAMGVMFAVWYLAEKDKLARQGHRLVRGYLGEGFDSKLSRVLAVVDECFSRYFAAQLLEALIFGSLVAAGSALFGLPAPLALGALVAALSLVPMVGAPLGGVAGAVVVLSHSWQQAVVFLAVFVAVMLVEQNLIYGRIVGKRVGLDGMWPLVGVTIGGALFGIPGAFVGVPVTAVAFRLVERDLDRREGPGDAASPLGVAQPQ